ncbi:MAG: hypothetical protein QHH14_01215 [Clostridiales bacterium]|jgi:hypothetical protein|nr:hypothetical protein [Clostridiales bacterium]
MSHLNYPKPVRKIELVGVDVYIISPELPKLPKKVGPFHLDIISNRGLKVYPGPTPEALCVNWWRCRYKADSPITDKDVDNFVLELSPHFWWSAVQKLWNYDGEPGFTVAY